jgi:hypothetical protein
MAVAVGLVLSDPLRSEPAKAVDLQLLFAVDVSPSVDADEYALQIHGLANALRDPEVIDAISTATPNGVAMALMQWAGPREQVVSVPWSVVTDQASAGMFAALVDASVRPTTNGGTSIGDALARGVSLMDESGLRGTRRVIDVSGDGSTNLGDSPGPVRFLANSKGIVVNGLVILNEEPQLGAYYLRRVVGGPGSFVMEIEHFGDFASAMRAKLMHEIEMSMATHPPRLIR